MRNALLVLLIACGGGTKTQPTTPDPTPPPPSAQEKPAMIAQTDTRPACTEADIPCAIDTLEYFSKKMCVCTEKACAEGINNEMTKWGEEMAKKAPPKNQKPTEDEQKRLMTAVNAYTECMTKLMIDAPPPTDPCGGGDPCGG